MSCKKASELHKKCIDEEIVITFYFIKDLATEELLSGIPLIEEVGTSDLTITEESINQDEIDFNGLVVPVRKSARCLVVGGLAKTYILKATVSTSSVPPQKLVGLIDLEVSA